MSSVQVPVGSNVTISTQADLALLAGLTNIPGNLVITGANITDLSALSSLTRIGGDLTVSNTASLKSIADLTVINSFAGLTEVGRLVIQNNTVLSDLSLGFPVLTSVVTDFTVANNPALDNCQATALLTQVSVPIPAPSGIVTISGNLPNATCP